MKKIFKNIEVLGIVSYFNQTDIGELPIKLHWNLKKNIDKMKPIASTYDGFRDECVKAFQAEWFDDEHSDIFTTPKLDENGNTILDAEGNEVTTSQRKVKNDYMPQYRKAVDEINKKLEEISQEENEIEIITFDIDSFVESLPDDTSISFDTLKMLSFMDTSTNVAKDES